MSSRFISTENHRTKETFFGVTPQQFNTLEDLFTFYNEKLFAGSLPYCLVNLSRHRLTAGFFIEKNWQSVTGETKHEISINPDTMGAGDMFWHSTLVHEMVHMWQFEFGKPSRYNYHNKEWALKMMDIGLMPTSTGQPGGKPIGQNMDHYAMEGRGFQQAFNSISDQELLNLRLPYINTASMRLMATEGDEGVGEADPDEPQAEPVESRSEKKPNTLVGVAITYEANPDLICTATTVILISRNSTSGQSPYSPVILIRNGHSSGA